MIVKMLKYNFLVYHAQYDEFLHKLRDIGVLHIATLDKDEEEYEILRDKFTLKMRIDKLITRCTDTLSDAKLACTDSPADISLEKGMELLEELEDLYKQEEMILQNISLVEREQLRLSIWGEFDLAKINRLKDNGYLIGLYSCQARNYDNVWEDIYNSFIVRKSANDVYFVTVTKEEIKEIEAEPFNIGEYDSITIKRHISELKDSYIAKQKEIIEFAVLNIKNLNHISLIVNDEINISAVHINSISAADDKVKILVGYCPNDITNDLNTMLQENEVYYDVSEPTESDDVPVKLKNNGLTRLFEPLTGMYGIPSYYEYDPTPILAPFFLLFFAMCMGDGGYGLILILFGLALKYQKLKIEMFDGLGNIITVLGCGTTVIGLFLGTAFGIDLYNASFIPNELKSLMIKGTLAGYDIQMVLSILIGVFHICLAMIIKAVGSTQRFGLKANISTWSWLLLILGGITTGVLYLMETVSLFAAEMSFVIIGSVSALGIYIFSDIKRNVLVNIGAGLWDTYNMATGLLGDVLSYIRLYALGLAGGMLGGAFNTLGSMILGDSPSVFMWIPFFIIIIIGHSLNLVMSSLGAFVHPLRLTFIEYFKNSGYEGKGQKYAPFAESIKQNA